MRDATRICDYFYGAMTLFIIPLYQRKYAWQQKHCSRLFEDLKKIHRQGIYSHFFGSIVATRVNDIRKQGKSLVMSRNQRFITYSRKAHPSFWTIEEASITAGMTLQMNLTRRKITAKS